VHDLPSNSPSSPLSQKLPGEVIRLLNMNGRREGAVYIPFNFCVLLSRWLNMIVLAVMSLIRGYFPSARLTVELCCSSGVHTAAGHHLLISSSHQPPTCKTMYVEVVQYVTGWCSKKPGKHCNLYLCLFLFLCICHVCLFIYLN